MVDSVRKGEQDLDRAQGADGGEERVLLDGAASLFQWPDKLPIPRDACTGSGPLPLGDDGGVRTTPVQAQELPAEELPRALWQRPGEAQEDGAHAPLSPEPDEFARLRIEPGSEAIGDQAMAALVQRAQ